VTPQGSAPGDGEAAPTFTHRRVILPEGTITAPHGSATHREAVPGSSARSGLPELQLSPADRDAPNTVHDPLPLRQVRRDLVGGEAWYRRAAELTSRSFSCRSGRRYRTARERESSRANPETTASDAQHLGATHVRRVRGLMLYQNLNGMPRGGARSYLAGASRFSSSNQFCTKIMRANGGRPSGALISLIIRNR
jgi:hypothetical protein